MTTTSDNNSTQDATAAQVAKNLKTTLSSADASVTQAIQTLGLVHQARLSRQNRTVAALTAQYGASDPRVTAAQASVAATQTTIARVSVLQQQLAVPAVQVAENGWALQGYVLDTEYNPMAKYTVFLVDANHAFLRQYGFAYTDDTGYFLINYSGDTDTAAPALFIGVVDTKANPVYLSSTAFQPVPGSAVFENIFIPTGGQTLGDPTQAIRDVAFPADDVAFPADKDQPPPNSSTA